MSPTSDSSQPSIAVIAACATVGGLVFIFLAVRIGLCIHRRRNSKMVPLPPVRPLTALQTMPWNANANADADASASKINLSTPSSSPTTYHPDLLMAQNKYPQAQARSVYRQYSGSTLNTTEETPLHQPPSPGTPLSDAQLIPPQPSFFAYPGDRSNRSSSQISVLSSTEESDAASFVRQRPASDRPLPAEPLTDDASLSQPNSSPSQTPLPSLLSPSLSARKRARRISGTGSVSSMQTIRSARSTRSASTVRGPPHKTYSRVDIVLPAPLAPQGQSYAQPYAGDASDPHDMSDVIPGRQSVCDPWLRVGREGTGLGPAPAPSPSRSTRERARRSRTLSSESQPASRQHRPSLSQTPNYTTSANPSSNSSTAYAAPPYSNSSPQSLRQKISLDMSSIPPVPRVPSMYAVSPASCSPASASASASASPSPVVLALSDSINGNGQLRGLLSDAAITDRALPRAGDSARSIPKPTVIPDQNS